MSAQALGAAGLARAPRGGGPDRQAGCLLHRAGSKGSLGGGGGFLHLAVLSSCFLSIERSDNALLTQLPGLLVDNSTSVRVSSGMVPCRSPASRLAAGGAGGGAGSWCPRARPGWGGCCPLVSQ